MEPLGGDRQVRPCGEDADEEYQGGVEQQSQTLRNVIRPEQCEKHYGRKLDGGKSKIGQAGEPALETEKALEDVVQMGNPG